MMMTSSIIIINIFFTWKSKREANHLIRALITGSDTRSYPEVIEHNPRAQDVPVQRDQVRLEGFDEETGLVSVDVQTVALQQLLLVPPALRPVLRQLLYLRRGGSGLIFFSLSAERRARARNVSTRLPSVRSAARCQTGFHPSHHLTTG